MAVGLAVPTALGTVSRGASRWLSSSALLVGNGNSNDNRGARKALRSCLVKVREGQLSRVQAERAADFLQHSNASTKDFTIVIVALGRCSSWPKALRLFEAMCAQAVYPDPVAYGAAVGSCAKGVHWAHAIRLAASSTMIAETQFKPMEIMSRPSTAFAAPYERGAKHMSAFISPFNAAISACAKKSQWQWAMVVLFSLIPLASLKPDIISVNSAITACERGARWERALRLLDFARHMRCGLQTASFNAAMGAVAKVGNWEMNCRLLHMIKQDALVPDVISLNAAIVACAEVSNWETSLRVIGNAKASLGISLDVANFNAAMNACTKGSQWRWSLHLLQVMQLTKVNIDATSFGTVISACEKSGRTGQALRLLGTMRHLRVNPDHVVCSSMMSACEKAGRWELALDILSQMRRFIAADCIDVVAWNAAVSACDKGTQWARTIHMMDSMAASLLSPNIITFGAAVSACTKDGRWSEALYLLRWLYNNGIAHDAVILTCAARAFEDMGEYCRVVEILLVVVECIAMRLAASPHEKARAYAHCTGAIELVHGHGVLLGGTLDTLWHRACAPALQDLKQMSNVRYGRTFANSRNDVRSPYLQGICDFGDICTQDALQTLKFDDGMDAAMWLRAAQTALCAHVFMYAAIQGELDDCPHALALPSEPIASRMAVWASHDLHGGACSRWQATCSGEVSQGGSRESHMVIER